MLLTPLHFGAFALIAIAAAAGPPQPRRPNNTPPPYLDVLDRAHKAKANDPASVRALIDAIFDAGVFGNIPESIRERLARADLGHRRGQEPGITEADIVSAINSAASLPGAPRFMKTSIDQVRGYREIARAMVPLIGAQDGMPKPAMHEMSPAEAIFVITALGTQKLFNPEFRVTPDEWAAAFRSKKEKASRGTKEAQANTSHKLHGTRLDPETAAILRGLEDDVKDESSLATVGIHLFLDQLGIRQ